jgi:hypothetical protein
VGPRLAFQFRDAFAKRLSLTHSTCEEMTAMKNSTSVKFEKKGASAPVSQATSGATSQAAAAGSLDNASEAPATSCEDKIRDLAYEKWQASGCPEGDGVEFWLEAEREISSAS